MKYTKTLFFLALLIVITSCSENNKESERKKKSKDEITISYLLKDDAQTKNINQKGEMIVRLSTNDLGKALTKAITEKGAENAIEFCNLEAINITDSLAKAENVIIRRLADKNRNPLNKTNNVELTIYKQYVDDWMTNQPTPPKIVINENGHPVYYKPIFIKEKCLTCHGTPGVTMPLNLSNKINELYPNDKATNFELGHPRGMWAITFTDLSINKK